MNSYGNILTLFDMLANQQVIDILKANGCHYTEVGNTFFLNTATKDSTTALIGQLNAIKAKFSFVHIEINTGTYVQASGVDAAALADIRTTINPKYKY